MVVLSEVMEVSGSRRDSSSIRGRLGAPLALLVLLISLNLGVCYYGSVLNKETSPNLVLF